MTGLVLQVSTSDAEQTRRLGAALAELARPGDVFLLLGDLGAGKTVLAQGLGAGLGVDDVITSPTFALVQSYEGRLGLHHLDVYRLEQVNEALDLGLAELLDDGSVVVVEWGDRIAPVLPQDYLEVRLVYGPRESDRAVELVPVGSRSTARRRALATVLATFGPDGGVGGVGEEADGPPGGARADPRHRDGHGGRSAAPSAVTRACWPALSAPVASATPRTSAPAIEFICGQARVELADIGLVAVDVGPGLFTGLRVGVATAKAIAFALRVPMIGVSSLDLLAFPVRFSPRLIVAAIDARRGELYYAMYRQVPGGVQRLSEQVVGSPDDLASELHRHRRGGAAGRRRRPSATPRRSRALPGWRSWTPAAATRPRPRWCSSPIPVRCARSSSGPSASSRSTFAGPTPRSTGRPGMAARATAPGTHTGGAAGAPNAAASGAPSDGVIVTGMRRRHLRAVTAIERQVNPHPWSHGLFAGELRMPSSRAWVVARAGHRVVGFGGLMVVLEEGHITNVAVDPEFHRRHVATRMLLVLASEAVRSRVVDLTLEVRASNRAAQRLYQRFGFAPAGIGAATTATTGEDALVMWAHDIAASEAVRPSASPSIDAALPAALRFEPSGIGSPRPRWRSRPAPRRSDARTHWSPVSSWCSASRPAATRRRRPCVRRRPRGPVVGGVEPGRPARPLRRCGARDRQPRPRRAAHPGDRPGPRRGRRRRRQRRRGGGHDRARPDRCAAGRGGAAKALALVWDVPFVAVNHLEAHLYAALLEEPELAVPVGRAAGLRWPHDARRDGRTTASTGCWVSTLDDAAGEAFDKVARYLGLGYPGGPAIDRSRCRAIPRPSPSRGR